MRIADFGFRIDYKEIVKRVFPIRIADFGLENNIFDL